MENRQGEPIEERLLGHEDAVTSVALSSDGQLVVSCSDDNTIRIWSVRTGKEVMIRFVVMMRK